MKEGGSIPEQYLTDYIYQRKEKVDVLAAITPNPDDPVIDEALYLDDLILRPDPWLSPEYIPPHPRRRREE